MINCLRTKKTGRRQNKSGIRYGKLISLPLIVIANIAILFFFLNLFYPAYWSTTYSCKPTINEEIENGTAPIAGVLQVQQFDDGSITSNIILVELDLNTFRHEKCHEEQLLENRLVLDSCNNEGMKKRFINEFECNARSYYDTKFDNEYKHFLNQVEEEKRQEEIKAILVKEQERYGELAYKYALLNQSKRPINIELGFYNITDCKVKINKGRADNWIFISNKSNSMFPCIDTAVITKIYYEEVGFAQISEGDVVIYNKLGKKDCKNYDCTIHRVVIETDTGWVARGDANSVWDYYLITENNFIGRVVWVE